MKISDVLWEAACKTANNVIEHNTNGNFSCITINQIDGGSINSNARKFYEENFGPTNRPDGYTGGGWWLLDTEKQHEDAGQERFFHLLMAYEMAKSEGL